MTLALLRQQVASGELAPDLLDDPDCLAEQEFTYSVFRFRHSWGTHYEVTFTNHADGDDRSACWALIPAAHIILETVDTDTTGVGFNGVVREVTHRLIAHHPEETFTASA